MIVLSASIAVAEGGLGNVAVLVIGRFYPSPGNIT
jgi:hypothetical protein